jgi:hypothetical protein
MKGHTAPHTVVIQNSRELFALGDWTAQIDLQMDQFVETQHKSFRILFRMNKQERTILSK